jgi:hypothetical protein
MTYSVPDPASESPDPLAPDPAAPTASAVVGPDGSGVEQAAKEDPPLPSRLGVPAAGATLAPPQAQVGEVAAIPAAPITDDGTGADRDRDVPTAEAGVAGADAPLRVGHEDSEEYEQFVTDPEAAEEATRIRMDAQAEAEKAAAGITPAADES